MMKCAESKQNLMNRQVLTKPECTEDLRLSALREDDL